jgi:hypothetical protein
VLQTLSQQTSSTQKPLAHALPAVHEEPCGAPPDELELAAVEDDAPLEPEAEELLVAAVELPLELAVAPPALELLALELLDADLPPPVPDSVKSPLMPRARVQPAPSPTNARVAACLAMADVRSPRDHFIACSSPKKSAL